jgi:sortase (surface protein transpeptidase)
MSNWRAKRFSLSWNTLNRRHRIQFTVRRFRLARRSAHRHQYVLNVRLGRIRQLHVLYQRPGHNKLTKVTYRYRWAAATVLIVFGLFGMAYSASTLLRTKRLEPAKTYAAPAVSTKKAEPATRTAAQPPALAKSNPTHISITSQNIETDLIPVGLNPDGSIETPPVLEWLAGWYKYSPTPGEIGPSVIVGHVDSYEGTSVFWNLRYVQPGDAIAVTREDGSTARFTVTALGQYDQNDFPTELVYGNTSDAELRVITCGGTFDSNTGHYTENTVVYAKLISSP